MFTFTIPTPKTATEAVAQAYRYTSAQEIIAEGYTFPVDTDLNVIFVCKPGKLSFDYIIHLDAANSLDNRAGCSCPDAAKGNCCKHYMAAKILHG